MELPIWNLLKIYYDSSQGVIRDKITNIFSEPFKIESGVKQGGFLSSHLYNKLIDRLIESIIELDIGAHIGIINVSVIVYADDIIIISPRSIHLQKILDTCSDYGKELKFNPHKSNIIEFGKQIIQNNIFKIGDNKIPIVDEIIYLGITLNKNLNFDTISREKFKMFRNLFFPYLF